MRSEIAFVSLVALLGCDHSRSPGVQTAATSTSSPATSPSASVSASAPASASPSASASASGSASALASAAPSTSPPPAEPAPEGMLLVPAGQFTMGADTGGEEDERPAHAVTLKAFYFDKTEVTNAAYAECVTAGVCRAKSQNEAGFSDPQQPVDYVSWDDAKTYCGWKGKRLPREAEFERSVRDDDGRTYPWGNNPPTKDLAVFSQATTQPVGSRGKPGEGPYGHDDLAGNVWEWQQDFYDPYAYRRSTAPDGQPGTCEEIMTSLDQLRRDGKQGFTGSNPIPNECEHSIRGGAFNYAGPGLRSTNRVHHPGRFRIRMLGFRCAKDAS